MNGDVVGSYDNSGIHFIALSLAQLFEKLLREGSPRVVDRPVYAVEKWHEWCEVGGQVELY